MPQKNHDLSVNGRKLMGQEKMKWLLMTFSLPMNYGPRLFFMGKTKTRLPWKFSLKLFSTVKLRLKIIIMNQSNEKRKQTEKTYQIGEFMLLLKCIYSLDNTGVNRCVSSFHYHIASIHQSRVFKTNQHLPKLHTGFSQLTFHCQLLLS